ncbi:hypothetical protein [Streptomyces triculaminicus]|uniref:Uncharacterized protein n=1 Tax=Streptomyces triculaminicus TaxID=2816232 RepID=A0A939JUX3_9ACTN|nr:hypothetical protein [Streptomyces triculaminicus]MBO0657224.1 hypothetical protein [Streptomyces triculaminicus]
MVYDTFAETASQLTGQYIALSRAASTEEESEEWWQKVMTLRDTQHAVPARDRAQLIAHIRIWRAELEALKAARG